MTMTNKEHGNILDLICNTIFAFIKTSLLPEKAGE